MHILIFSDNYLARHNNVGQDRQDCSWGRGGDIVLTPKFQKK